MQKTNFCTGVQSTPRPVDMVQRKAQRGDDQESRYSAAAAAAAARRGRKTTIWTDACDHDVPPATTTRRKVVVSRVYMYYTYLDHLVLGGHRRRHDGFN